MIEISGVAMTEGAAPEPSSKYYPSDELEASAGQLTDAPVFQRGKRTVSGTVGRVTSAEFDNGALSFTADVVDELAEKVQSGEADVRALGRHKSDLEKNDDGQRVVSGLTLLGLSIKEPESNVEAAQLASTTERTPPPIATMEAFTDGDMAFSLSAEIDENMTESITVDETTYSQLTELRSAVEEFDDSTPMNDVISYVASEAGAPTEGEIEAEQSRLLAEHSPSDGNTSEELSDDRDASEELTEQEQIEQKQQELRERFF